MNARPHLIYDAELGRIDEAELLHPMGFRGPNRPERKPAAPVQSRAERAAGWLITGCVSLALWACIGWPVVTIIKELTK